MNITTIKTMTIFGTHTDEKSKLRWRDRYSDTKEEAKNLADEFIVNIKNKLESMPGVIKSKFYIDEVILSQIPDRLQFYFDREKWLIHSKKNDNMFNDLSSYDGNGNESGDLISFHN